MADIRSGRTRRVLVTTIDQAERAVRAAIESRVVGFDIETTGLSAHDSRWRLAQITTGDTTYIIDLFAVDSRVLRPMILHCDLVGHNLSFESSFVATNLGIYPERVWDTMLASQVLDAHLEGQHSLDQVARRRLHVELDKTFQKANWAGPLSEPMLNYAAIDSEIVLALRATLEPRIVRDGLAQTLALEHAILPGFSWMHVIGAPFDSQAWLDLLPSAEQDLLDADQALAELTGKKTLFGDSAINWNSAKEVLAYFSGRGILLENTAKETLIGLATTDEASRLILAWREAQKKVSTYGRSFLEYVSPTTGRIHSRYAQCRAKTGRTSSSDPNAQNLPRDRRYRACFRAAPGKVLVKADLSQIELRIAAEVTRDARLLQAYRPRKAGEESTDIHRLIAARLTNKKETQVSDEERSLAKACNFGFLYGMGAKTFLVYALANYGLRLTLDQAQQFRRDWLALFPGVKAWHDSIQDGYEDVFSIGGRRLRFVEDRSLKLNMPIQATAADGAKQAMKLLWKNQLRVPSARPVIFVHDEFVLEVDEEEAAEAKTLLEWAMTEGFRPYTKLVSVEVEGKISHDWAGNHRDLP